MAKKNFGLIAGLDKIVSIIKLLVAGIEAEGGTDGNEILSLLDTQDPAVVAALKAACAELAKIKLSPFRRLLAELACDGYVHPELLSRGDELFPGADPDAPIKGVRPVDIGKAFTRSQADAYLASLTPPMKFCNPDKGVRWAAANPNAQRRNPLLIMGQVGLNSGGDEVVLLLYGNARERRARLNRAASEWGGDCLVLAESKE
jgi:hypothetical protein